PHRLRATYGTELYKITKDIYKVATALGHSSVETTRKHYADFDENQKKEIAGQVRVGH
ncbi:MAG: tyrosine-type recombinase/integrase, partial [Clostridia bacterium]|nr:tyrosine-type recombinase/integrase [Clostridia bacterium]